MWLIDALLLDKFDVLRSKATASSHPSLTSSSKQEIHILFAHLITSIHLLHCSYLSAMLLRPPVSLQPPITCKEKHHDVFAYKHDVVMSSSTPSPPSTQETHRLSSPPIHLSPSGNTDTVDSLSVSVLSPPPCTQHLIHANARAFNHSRIKRPLSLCCSSIQQSTSTVMAPTLPSLKLIM